MKKKKAKRSKVKRNELTVGTPVVGTNAEILRVTVDTPSMGVAVTLLGGPTVPVEDLKRTAARWAIECGLQEPLEVSNPEIVVGGYLIAVRDVRGRSGHAKLTREGKPSMWERTDRTLSP